MLLKLLSTPSQLPVPAIMSFRCQIFHDVFTLVCRCSRQYRAAVFPFLSTNVFYLISQINPLELASIFKDFFFQSAFFLIQTMSFARSSLPASVSKSNLIAVEQLLLKNESLSLVLVFTFVSCTIAKDQEQLSVASNLLLDQCVQLGLFSVCQVE